MLRKIIGRIKEMAKKTDVKTAKIDSDDPKVTEQFKNFIDNDSVMLAVYRDDEGTMYVALSDKNEPKRCIVVTAEAMYRSTDILGDVFATKSTAKVHQVLN